MYDVCVCVGCECVMYDVNVLCRIWVCCVGCECVV